MKTTLSNKTLTIALIVSAILSLVLFTLLGLVDKPLKTGEAPNGILSFEFAEDFSRSLAIMDSWTDKGKTYAAFSIGLDFLFLVCYPVFFSLACFMLARRFREQVTWFYKVGAVIMWLPLVSGLLDTVENIAMIRLLFGTQQHWLSPLAFYCASVKFLFLGFAVIFIVSGLLLMLFFTKKKSK